MTATGFWGLLIEPGKMYSQKVPASFKVAMASLGPEEEDSKFCVENGKASSGRTTVLLRIQDEDDYAICSLTPGVLEQQPLDLVLRAGGHVAFLVSGPFPIHLTGYFIRNEEDNAELESKEEEECEFEKAQGSLDKISKKRKISANVAESDSDDSDDSSKSSSGLETVPENTEAVKRKKVEDDRVNPLGEHSHTQHRTRMQRSERRNQKPDANEGSRSERSHVKKQKNDRGLPVIASKMSTKIEAQSNMESDQTGESKSHLEKEGPHSPSQELRTAIDVDELSSLEPIHESSKKPLSKTQSNRLVIEDIIVGEGPTVVQGDRLAIAYVAKLKSGRVFDKTQKNELFSFNVGSGEVVKGMDIGVQGMCVGGKRRLTIPAALAYGSQKFPGIPSNSTLIFEVTAKKVGPSKQGLFDNTFH